MSAFAALEQRTAAVCIKRLSNVSVTGAPQPYTAILDHFSESAYGDGGIQGVTHVLQYRTSDDAALKRNDTRVVNAVSYVVLGPPDQVEDGLMSVARLRKA